MDAPRFSLKRLLVSVLWVSVGLGGIAFSIRPGSVLGVSSRASDDWLAELEPVVRETSRVVGGVFVCIGVIPLVTKRRPMRVLIHALYGATAGAVVGAVVATQQHTYEQQSNSRPLGYICVTLGAAAAILLAAVVPPSGSSQAENSADSS